MRVLPIPGYPLYFATEEGHIVSFRGWHGRELEEGRELREFDRKTKHLRPSPYLSVNLSIDGSQRNRYVHHLVALAFHGERPDGAEVCHGPGGSRDNRPINLRYDTKEANSAERNHCRGDAWHDARGAFDDLLEVG